MFRRVGLGLAFLSGVSVAAMPWYAAADGESLPKPITRALVYGGSDAARPYQFLDAQGQPQGFNVELVRALGRIAGRPINVRLGRLSDAQAQLAARDIDLMVLGATPGRTQRFALLDELWSFRQAVLFLPRPSYPHGLRDLAGEIIAVQEGNLMIEILLSPPEPLRPKIVTVRNQADAIEMLKNGGATAIAGNSLVFQTALVAMGIEDVHEVVLESTPYVLATAKGREEEMAWVGPALRRLRETGEFSQLVEKHLGSPHRVEPTWRMAAIVAMVTTPLLVVSLLALAWNRGLRSQVTARTRELAAVAAEKAELAESLRQKEERYRAFLSHSTEAIWRCEFSTPWPTKAATDERIRHFREHAYVAEGNAAMARLYGFRSVEDAVGATFADLEARAPLLHDRDHLREFLTSDNWSARWEAGAAAEDGAARWFLLTFVGIGEEGSLRRTWAIAQDVTLRRQAEEGLRFSLAVVRATLESTAEGILVEDSAGGISDVNVQFGDLWGIPQAQLLRGPRQAAVINRRLARQVADPEPFMPRVRAIRDQPESPSFDVLRLRDGRVLERVSSPQRVDGVVAGRVWSFRDVTEIERALLTVQAVNRQLELKNEELEQFTRTVSHDLKSPLITIRGYLDQIQRSASEGQLVRLQEDADRIRRATGRMEDLLSDLLALSRVGRVMAASADVPMSLVVNDAADMVRGRLLAGHIQLEVADDLPVVRCDRTRLSEVVQNLLENAVKFRSEAEPPWIRVGARSEAGRHVFFVQDNGLGVESKYHQKIFGLFEKLDPRAEGTGLGLALVKKVIEAHEGTVWVESQGKDRGSTFFFSLPR